MFRALLRPSSGARDYAVDYHIGLSFCKDGGGSVNLNLWFLVVCVRCEVLCHFVVVGNLFLLILIFVIFMRGSRVVLISVV